MGKLTRVLCVALAGLVSLSGALAAEVQLEILGVVQSVNDSILPGAPATGGVTVGERFPGSLAYNDATGQVSGDFISFQLTSLSLTVTDETQLDGEFELIPAELNTATRIVFQGNRFQGLVLPNNVTALDDLDAFGLSDVAFEASGFDGPDFKFNFGSPVVAGVLEVLPDDEDNEIPIPAPALALLGALLAFIGGRRQLRRRPG